MKQTHIVSLTIFCVLSLQHCMLVSKSSPEGGIFRSIKQRFFFNTIEGRFHNKTKSTIKIAVDLAMAKDPEIKLAKDESDTIKLGLHKTRSYVIRALVVKDEDTADEEEVLKIERNRYGSFDCTIFMTKEKDPANPKLEKITYWCVEKEPIKGKEFTRPTRGKKTPFDAD